MGIAQLCTTFHELAGLSDTWTCLHRLRRDSTIRTYDTVVAGTAITGRVIDCISLSRGSQLAHSLTFSWQLHLQALLKCNYSLKRHMIISRRICCGQLPDCHIMANRVPDRSDNLWTSGKQGTRPAPEKSRTTSAGWTLVQFLGLNVLSTGDPAPPLLQCSLQSQ